MDSIMTWTANADDENYALLKEMYNAVVGQHLRYIFHAMKYVGGRYCTAGLRSENVDNYDPVERTKQKEAVKFLKDYLFTDLPWLYGGKPAEIMGMANITRYRERIMGKCMAQLLTSVQYLWKAEEIDPDAYTCQEFTDDMYAAIWGNLSNSKPLSAFERSIQNNYLFVICTIVESGPMEVVPELLSLYATQMDRIAKEAKKKMTRTNDFMTKNHLQGIIRRIEVCQNGGEVK